MIREQIDEGMGESATETNLQMAITLMARIGYVHGIHTVMLGLSALEKKFWPMQVPSPT